MAVAMIISVVFSTGIFCAEKSKFIFSILLLAIFAVFLIIFAFLRKKWIAFVAILCLFAFLPAISMFVKSKQLNENLQAIDDSNFIVGRICDISQNSNNEIKNIYLENVRINSTENSKKFYGKIIVRLNTDNVDVSKIHIGSQVKLYTTYSVYTLQDENLKQSLQYISKGVNASCFAKSYTFEVLENEQLTVRENIKNKVFEMFDRFGDSFTNIGYAMMFGDSATIDTDFKAVLTNSGTGHLLAVSGFHITILIGLLSFILGKLKLRKFAKFGIIAVFLLFYSYICAFSVSVIRACIMSLVMLYAVSRNKEYDKLSALSLACIILLLFNPLVLFSASFLLSFLAVLSIILLKPLFDRLLGKILKENFASFVSLCLSVSLGVFLAQIYIFGKVYVLGFTANLITVPVISAAFSMLFLVVILGLIFPFIFFLIRFFGVVVRYVLMLNKFLSFASFEISKTLVSETCLILSVAEMFVVSDYVFMRKKIKIITASILAAGIILTIFI